MNDKKEVGSMLTDAEQKRAIRYYSYGWSFQEITDRILAIRNDSIKRDMLREVGMLVSKHYKRQMYPVEFYGKVAEE